LTTNNEWVDRIPAWIRYAVQDEKTKIFDGVFWNPQESYNWKHQPPHKHHAPKIYECHIGMAGEEE